MSRLALWQERASRLRARLSQTNRDIKRDMNWYAGGGREFFRRYVSEIVAAHKWCFIVGCNNSGTSLLQSILERSGQISTMPHEGQRYTRVLTRAARRGHERVWTELLSELRLSASDDLTRAPRLLHDWMRELETPIQEIIVEKTTANAVRMPWLQKAFPRSCFIGLVRNGYAVVEGICRKGRKPMQRGARHWNLVNRIMMEDAEQVESFLLLRYEDLVQRRETTARKIEGFLGLEDRSLQGPLQGKFSFTTVLGNDDQPIRDFNADSIRKLSAEDIEAVHSLASEMLDYFGYDASLN